MIIAYDWWKHKVLKILDNEDNFIVQMVEKLKVASCMPCETPITGRKLPPNLMHLLKIVFMAYNMKPIYL